jgi:hypothetical protein
MTNSLIKRLSAALEATQSNALALSSPAPDIWTPRQACRVSFVSAPATRAGLPQDLEFPRHCAKYEGEMWLAVYELDAGRYHYANSIEWTPQQKDRYGPENMIAVPAVFRLEAERCGCCGAWTRDGSAGAVWCPQHNGGTGARVCYGRTSRSGYFICSCGNRGQLAQGLPDNVALVPGRMRGNFGMR